MLSMTTRQQLLTEVYFEQNVNMSKDNEKLSLVKLHFTKTFLEPEN